MPVRSLCGAREKPLSCIRPVVVKPPPPPPPPAVLRTPLTSGYVFLMGLFQEVLPALLFILAVAQQARPTDTVAEESPSC